jgi:hypothetical protein
MAGMLDSCGCHTSSIKAGDPLQQQQQQQKQQQEQGSGVARSSNITSMVECLFAGFSTWDGEIATSSSSSRLHALVSNSHACYGAAAASPTNFAPTL